MRPTARSAIALLLCAPAFVWSAELLAGTPPLILMAAMAPAALVAAVAIFAQRGRGRPAWSLAFAFAWGAVVAAWISTTGNELARSWIDARSHGDDRVLTALVVAPLLEEGAKALGLLLLTGLTGWRLRDARDGIVLGALVGIGFVLTENLLYLGVAMLQGGEAGLVRALYLRGILGAATHGVFTACAGAGIGWAAAGGGGIRIALAGFLAAHVQHVVWNGLGAALVADVLCGAQPVCLEAPTTLAVYGQSTAITLAFIAPGLAALVAAWRRPPASEA
jgi:RsiW-degrading membrane proteinase PrsW (M82 family)